MEQWEIHELERESLPQIPFDIILSSPECGYEDNESILTVARTQNELDAALAVVGAVYDPVDGSRFTGSSIDFSSQMMLMCFEGLKPHPGGAFIVDRIQEKKGSLEVVVGTVLGRQCAPGCAYSIATTQQLDKQVNFTVVNHSDLCTEKLFLLRTPRDVDDEGLCQLYEGLRIKKTRSVNEGDGTKIYPLRIYKRDIAEARERFTDAGYSLLNE